MAIKKINNNLPTTTKIEQLNSMILELQGLIAQAGFNKNCIDSLHDQLAESTYNLDRKFRRNIGLGNTLSNYTDWSHLYAESAYSIWKLTPAKYAYNSLNELYFDDKVFENRGLAGAEAITAFDKVKLYNGDSDPGYIDNTSEAATESGTEFEVMNSMGDYLYIGDAAVFSGVKFEWQTRGSNYTLKVEYWNGAWTEVDVDDNIDDDTNNFESDGKISWDDLSGDWATTTIDGDSKYWIRISTTTDPVTDAQAYLIVPYDSVIGLLALSSTQLLAEDWAWCSYSGSVYVTIPNTGATAYEGDTYITSASSVANLKNYLVYNHKFKANHEDNLYSGV